MFSSNSRKAGKDGAGKGKEKRYRDVPEVDVERGGVEDDAEEVERWEMEEQQVGRSA